MAFNEVRHPEEAAKRPSRRTHGADPATHRFLLRSRKCRGMRAQRRTEMNQQEEGFGFVPEHDTPIPYMQRIRDYYQTLGYGAPYRWAHYAEVPFAPLKKPLGECRIGFVHPAAPHQAARRGRG